MRRIWPSVKRLLHSAVTDNMGQKLVALLVALVLVTVVRFQEKAERWVDVEVNVRRPAAGSGVILANEPPDTVRVTLRGRASVLEAIKDGPIDPVIMDLSEVRKAGAFTYYFEPEQFNFAKSAVEILSVSPDSVMMRVERVMTRRVPLRIKLTGTLRQGSQMEAEPEISPTEISVSGPASVVRLLNAMETDAIDIEGLEVGEHSVSVPITRTEGLTVSRKEALVRFKVRWTPGQRMFSGLLVKARGEGGADAEIRPAQVAVSLIGPQIALDRLDPALLAPVVDLGEAQPEPRREGLVRAVVKVTGLPEDIKVKSVVPETVTVRAADVGARVRRPASAPE